MSKALKVSRVLSSAIRSLFVPTIVQIAIQPTENCDVGCSYCDRDWTATDEMTLGDVGLVVKKVKELHTGYINTTGGEPLTWKHIVAAISIFSRNQIGTFVSTAGFSLDEDMAHGLGLAGLDVCNLSLDGLVEVEHSRKTLNNHDSEFLDRFLELRKRYKVRLGMNSVISDGNVDQMIPLIDFAAKYKLAISFSYLVPEITPDSESGIILPPIPKEVIEAVGIAEKRGLIFGQLDYLADPSFDCFNAKKTAICLSPQMLLMYCYLSKGMTPVHLKDFDKTALRNHINGLEKYVKRCNDSCASHCAFMSDYAKTHPLSVLRNAWRLLIN
jgi:MoaA/NifB/PqqE/SkfB family radical SAM enzyme